MKKIVALVFMVALAVCVCAQSTSRKFVLKNSADGKSELTVYLPSASAAEKAGGRIIVDCPGGGYTHLAIDNEGHNWAEFFNAQGIAYVVLQYRMPNGDRNIPLSDAYNAIRTVRDSAKVWNVNPRNVGIMGFSAGGHLASSVSTHATKDVKPNFAILFYPVVSMIANQTHKGSVTHFLGENWQDKELIAEWTNYKKIDKDTPPTLLLLASDDKAVPAATNAALYYAALCKNKVFCEMHSYPKGGHGFGFRDTFPFHNRMLDNITEWLKSLPAPPEVDAETGATAQK